MELLYDLENTKKFYLFLLSVPIYQRFRSYYRLGGLLKRKKILSAPLILRASGYINNKTFVGKLYNLIYIGLIRYKNKYFLDYVVSFIQRNSFHRLRYLAKGIYYGLLISFIINEFFYRNGTRSLYVSRSLKEYDFLSTDVCNYYIREYQNDNIFTNIVNNDLNHKLNISKGISDQKWIKNKNSYMILDRDMNYKPLDYDSLLTEIDFIQIGKFMKSINQLEIANQAFYIAYLKNNQLGFNSAAKVEM